MIRCWKCKYRQIFLHKIIDSCFFGSTISKNVLVSQFLKSSTLRDGIWACAAAWNEVAKDTLINAWRKLWPHDLIENDDDKDAFFAFN